MTKAKRVALGRPPSMAAPRETILAQAASLFAEKGYEQTSLQDVASAVGVSKAALYHYFQSKQMIYDEIVVELLEGLYGYVKQNVTAAPAGKALLIFMRSHAKFFEENYVNFVTLLHGVGGIGAQMRSERQVAIRDQYEMLLRELLVNSGTSDRLRVDDVTLTATAILSMLNWMSRWYKPGGTQSAVEIAEKYYAVLYGGLHPDAERRSCD